MKYRLYPSKVAVLGELERKRQVILESKEEAEDAIAAQNIALVKQVDSAWVHNALKYALADLASVDRLIRLVNAHAPNEIAVEIEDEA